MREVSSEPPALEAVYRSSALALTRLAYLLVGDRTEAEDIVHTVFASVVPRWQTIDEPSAYLRRAVINRAHDVHRRRSGPLRQLTRRSLDRRAGRRRDMGARPNTADDAADSGRAALLRGRQPDRHRVAAGSPGEHSAIRSPAGVDEATEVAGVNDFDELDELDRELGPSLVRRCGAWPVRSPTVPACSTEGEVLMNYLKAPTEDRTAPDTDGGGRRRTRSWSRRSSPPRR